MTYSLDLRERVVSFVSEGGSKAEVSRRFKVSRGTVYGWLQREDLRPTDHGPCRCKLNRQALLQHLKDYPDALLRERAVHFGMSLHAVWYALHSLNVRKKKRPAILSGGLWKEFVFLRTLRQLMQRYGSDNIVYFDESGFEEYAYRPHGWAIRGQKVHGNVSGNNRKRTNLIMAQRKTDWLAPMLFEGSCKHKVVTFWVEKMLLPELKHPSVIIMDNAPFHNKAEIRQILEKHGHTLLPLTRYSPDFNPIEKTFAILKKRRQFGKENIKIDQLFMSKNYWE